MAAGAPDAPAPAGASRGATWLDPAVIGSPAGVSTPGAGTGVGTPGAPEPAPAPPAGGLRRRRLLLGGAAGAAVVAAAGVGGTVRYRRHRVVVPLLSETVAATGVAGAAGGAADRVSVRVGQAARVLPGTRVLRTAPGAADLAAAERAWLAAGAPWTTATGPAAALTRGALLDLRVLLAPGGAAVAGWSPGWRYVWPRDAAHVAAALAVSGHPVDAVAVLEFLQRAQRADGGFEARYAPDGTTPADGRPPELDGTGWVLWAATQLAGALSLSEAVTTLGRVRPMLIRAAGHALDAIDTADSLPAASPDYWETPETVVTLGTAAPLLAGLSSGAGLLALLGETALGREAAAGAVRLEAAITAGFAPTGYPRHLHGSDRDASVAFLLPPYAAGSVPAVVSALAESAASMTRPGGGLAPGSGWRDDGISWTPETALFALAAAGSGDATTARARLAWLSSHRTAAGSLPEKVLYDGRPASVAPLAWTAALVVLTLNALQPVTGEADDLH